MRTRIKVCCIATAAEAAEAVAAGASALGLVSAMPSGPGVIPESDIAAIAAGVPPGVATVLLTASTDPGEIAAQQRRCLVDTLQLVESVPPEDVRALRAALPGVRIVKVVHVEDASALSLAMAHAADGVAHALLLDSGNTRLPAKELGGTGRTHDWNVSRRIVAECRCPVWLAGGLRAGNVARAVATVRPFGVDVCSGVRTDDTLDADKLQAFMAAATAEVCA